MPLIQNIQRTSKYLYLINYIYNQEQLAKLEVQSIFEQKIDDKYYLTNQKIDLDRSIYIRGYIQIIYQSNTVEEIEQLIHLNHVSFEKYKIKYLRTQEHVEYNEWLNALKILGTAITGEFSLHNPEVELAVSKINNTWVFGYHIRNHDIWKNRIHKLHNYSNALEVKLSKSLINIAINNDFSLKVIDPCCGIGTVFTEGVAMGVDITGYDINSNVISHANENLKYLGFDKKVSCKDMFTITDNYDVAILDIPYGQFSLTSSKNQKDLIIQTRKISKKAIFISMDDMSSIYKECGFSILEQVTLPKSNSFKRHITICQ